MKIREGFVSNSSSSSFVVIGTSGVKQEINLEEDSTWYIIGEQGETEFVITSYSIHYTKLYEIWTLICLYMKS